MVLNDFEIAWVAAICVGVLLSKSPKVSIFLRWSFSYIKLGVLNGFASTHAILTPVIFHFRSIFYSELFSASSRAHKFGIKMLQIKKGIVLE